MSSKQSKLIVSVIRVVKPIITSLSVDNRRRGHNLLGVITGVPKEVSVCPDEACPLPAERLICENAPKEYVVLFLHGGSYLTGSLVGSRPVAGLLCEYCEMETFTFEYRLAPEHPFPAALEDAQIMWEYVLKQGWEPHNVILVGESAGGGLAFALCQMLREKNMPLPACIIGLSPWADLTEMSQSHLENEKTDPILTSDELRCAAVKYSAGESLKNPYLSPVFGDLSDFPPVLLHVGSREILLDDSKQLYERLNAAGVPVQLSIYDGMWHVFHGFDIPESKQAFAEIKEFVGKVLSRE